MAKAANNGEQTTTNYVLLERKLVYVALAPDGTAHEESQTEAWLPVLNDQGQPRWFTARGKQSAIHQYTGDGPEVVEGTYRAIPVSSWKGGVTTKRVTAAEWLPLEDL